MRTQWLVRKHTENDKAEHISQKLNIPRIIIDILMNRGLDDEREIEKLLYPKIEDMYDPFLMKDMEKAVTRIEDAVRKSEKVMIFGDYDADGITSTSLMFGFLKDQGLIADYYIPNRVEDGYGLSRRGINIAVTKGVDLIITVDCGITGFKEIDYANKNGIDVIITDHHEVMENIPNAKAVLNPHRYDDKYPFKYLAGCGVVLKLIQAYMKHNNQNMYDIEKYLDLTALGTVADVVPLIDENRIITYYGLRVMTRTKNLGLRALYTTAGLTPERITSFHIGFVIAPRINAVGRMSDANEAVRLFISEDECEVDIIANNLDEENTKRKKIDQEVFEEAVDIIEKGQLYKNNTIILARENWHEGVIGIVASRIVEKYFKPTIMISLGDDLGKGSGRSIPDFHMYDALNEVGSLLESFGGHKLAAGISIKRENLDKFCSEFEKIADGKLTEEDRIRSIAVDAEIELADIDDNLEKKLRLLAPFGYGNPMPLFVTRDINVLGYPLMFKNKHLRFSIGTRDMSLDCIWFNGGKEHMAIMIDDTKKIDVAYYIKRNNFQGKDEIQLQIKDLKAMEYENE